MFDLSIIQSLSGPAAFKRGEKLFAQAAVKIVKQSATQVSAKVKGTNIYSVDLNKLEDSVSNNIKAYCTCMAFATAGFCKHCVAVALTVNHPEFAGSATPLISDEDKLNDYLHTLDKGKLVDALFKHIYSDDVLTRQWLLKADLANKPVNDKDIKKLITKALPKRQMWEYNKVARYFANAQGMFDIFMSQLASLPAEQQLVLLDVALKRLNIVLGGIDDSGGYRFGVEEQIIQAIYSAFANVSWGAEQQASWLMQQFNDQEDVAINVPDGFELNAEVSALFIAKCQQAFNEHEVASDIKQRSWDYKLSRLGEQLLQVAKDNNDLHQQVKVREKLAYNIRDVLKICALYLAHDDELSAEDWLLKAKPLIDGESDETIWLNQAVGVALAGADKTLAWQYAWQKFNLNVNFAAYLELAKVCDNTASLTTEIEQQIETLLLGLYKEIGQGVTTYGDDVLCYYMHHGAVDKAIAWSDSHKADVYTLLKLADYIAKSYPELAMKYYIRSFNLMLTRASNAVYKEVTNYLVKLSEIWPYGSEQQQYFVEVFSNVKQKHKAKRNLMAMFEDHLFDYMLLLD